MGEDCLKYGPGDAWPQHPKTWWRKTLEHARERGWTLEKYSAHAFGKIECETTECSIPIFTSGTAGESVAKRALKAIESCVHSHLTQDVLVRVEKKLGQARRMVTAAEALLDKEQRERAIELLDEGDELTGAAWEKICDLIDEVDRYDEVINLEMAAAGVPAMDPSSIVSTAKGHVVEARAELAVVPQKAERVKILSFQAKELLREIEQLRNRLDA